MQLRLCTIFFILLGFSGHSQGILDKKVSLDFSEISIAQAIIEVSNSSGVDISFSKSFFDTTARVSMKVQEIRLKVALEKIISPLGLSYKIIGNQIVIYKPISKILSGFIVDKETGERLISASVYDKQNDIGVLSNEYGFFSMKAIDESGFILVSYVGYEPQFLDLTKNPKSENLRIELNPGRQLEEILIKANGGKSDFTLEKLDNSIEIQPKLIKASPALGGGEDYLRGAQLLAGVNSGIDGLGGLQVRGGDQGQNLMMLDGVTVFIPYHLLGVFSIYNPEMVSSAKLLKGSFPARYGGRVSSVFDVRTKEGNLNKWGGMASSNLVNVSALVEGPIKKGKSAILFSTRYSPSGALFNSFFKNTIIQNDEVQLRSNFFDANLKFNYNFGKKDRIYLSIFRGTDFFGSSFMEDNEEELEEGETIFEWSNTIGSLRWNHVYNEKLFSNTTFTTSFFGYGLTNFELAKSKDPAEENEFFLYSNSSQTQELGLNSDFDYYYNSKHQFRFGLGYSFSEYNLELSYFDDEDSQTQDLDEIDFASLDSLAIPQSIPAQNAHFYFEDQITFNEKWRANLGLRLSLFLSESEPLFFPEPRALISFSPTKNERWHLSGSRMVQYIHLISSAALRLPSDLWIPSGEELDPQDAWQAEFGYSLKFDKNWNFNSSLYYKNINSLYSYVDSLSFLEDFDDDSTQSFLTKGSGEMQGWETSLAYNTARNGFLLSYTLSYSMRQFEAHNLGRPYSHDFDQRHRWKIFAYHNLGKFQVGVNWVYFSPNPRIGYINIDGGEITRIELNEVGSKNKLRSEAYHRLDVSLSYKHQTKRVEHRIKFGLFNVYNRENIALYEAENEPILGIQSYSIASLGILPSLNYSIKF